MQLLDTIEACRAWVRGQRNQRLRIGLVPTMGNLHAGHLSLVEHLEPHCDVIVTSIFVNPTQFGPDEDFDQYPRTLEADLELLTTTACHTVFYPKADELYATHSQSQAIVRVPSLDTQHCAHSRPHFFSGVATVVTKLLNIVQPDCAIFGEKDFQQLRVIQALTRSLHLPVKIVSAPIVREPNGLAMSSRNRYLSAQQKEQAAQLYQILRSSADMLISGSSIKTTQLRALEQLTEAGFKVDYFNITDPDTLKLLSETQPNMMLLAAVNLDGTRLIDNLQIQHGKAV